MFSLIIAIIAIALVGVLALATIWYGTDAYQENLTSAGASQIINETEQIEGAILAFNVEQGYSPNVCDVNEAGCDEPLQDLIDEGYLSSAPTSGGATSSVWTVSDIDGAGTQALVKTVSLDECAEANKMMDFAGVVDYNSNNGAGTDLNPAEDDANQPILIEGLQMIPQCAAELPSNVVCCQTVTPIA